MDIPDGYSDIPSGKTVSVVTHLQMFQRPPERAERSEASWSASQGRCPRPRWYRSTYSQRIGENWLWFSRLQMNDDELRGVLSGPLCETYVFEVQGRDEGLVELDFGAEGECELSYFGLTPPLVGCGAGRWMMNRALELAWSRSIRRLWLHTCSSIIPVRWTSTSGPGSRPSAGRSRLPMTPGRLACCRRRQRLTCRCCEGGMNRDSHISAWLHEGASAVNC